MIYIQTPVLEALSAGTCVNSRPKTVFKDQEAVKGLSSLHDKYVIDPADKASNNFVFVCKSYYFEYLICTFLCMVSYGV
jgi:hypothetical protein